MQQRHGLGEVDDVDVGPRAEDVALHLRIPAVSLVAEVGASFEQLSHGEFRKRHSKCSFFRCASAGKTLLRESPERKRAGFLPARRRTPACVMAGQIGEGAGESKVGAPNGETCPSAGTGPAMRR